MSNSLVMNCSPHEIRVATVEGRRPVEIVVERKKDQSLVGNIYKGRVTRVLPGMQAAFVDIGLERAAFLYVADIVDPKKKAEKEAESRDSTISEATRDVYHRPIQSLLHEGQEIMVQVAKEPLGTKGARVTSHVSIAGRHLVYMPTVDHVGISRRITDEEERKRLKEILEALVPQGGGFVARTAADHRRREVGPVLVLVAGVGIAVDHVDDGQHRDDGARDHDDHVTHRALQHPDPPRPRDDRSGPGADR